MSHKRGEFASHFAMRYRLVRTLEVAYELSIGTKLGDLEWHNSPNGCVISPNSVAFGTDYVKVVEDIPILSAAEM